MKFARFLVYFIILKPNKSSKTMQQPTKVKKIKILNEKKLAKNIK